MSVDYKEECEKLAKMNYALVQYINGLDSAPVPIRVLRVSSNELKTWMREYRTWWHEVKRGLPITI